MLEKQKKEPGEAFVSTVLFDNRAEVLHDRVKVGEVTPITGKEYAIRGCTALLDAIGGAIHHIGNSHKYARIEDVPEHTLFVITTDGIENASRRYSAQRVKEMIQRQKEKYGWEFLFLGANIDAVETAGTLSIAPDRAAFVLRLQLTCLDAALQVKHLFLEPLHDGEKGAVLLAAGVIQSPVLPMGTGQRRALDIAAHGDHDIHGRQIG